MSHDQSAGASRATAIGSLPYYRVPPNFGGTSGEDVDEWLKKYKRVLVVPGDVSVVADVANVVQKTVKHFGKIDILVNNAGIAVQGSVQRSSVEDFTEAWETNLCGSIVNISAASGQTPTQRAVPYCVTKAALNHLTRCAALENAPYGVRVNTLSPGAVRTLIAKRPDQSAEEYLEHLDKIASSQHALGRAATPEEVAQCIAFLASDDSAFVTGITMLMDGGLLLLSSISGPVPQQNTKKTV
ncbi:glucose 1-dehydrogenase 1-like [Rhipicephalus sanguineus]|uniref:glucose 1-dehydrogenase 1-like n=1 Tax=Rhipicephalus sanguineus TaxID=34632 RepID=UPI0020C2B02F|nr:glucose 1-dehydrogenase 1-like [Rhipicephalus sanguineus]